jgi:hypothetical protein
VLVREDIVYVADMLRQRIVAFDTGGTEVGSTPLLVQGGLPMKFVPTPLRSYALHVRQMPMGGRTGKGAMRDWILIRDPSSERTDTLLELETGRTYQSSGPGGPRVRFFEPEPVWTLLSDGRVAHGRNDRLRIEIRGGNGALQGIITRPTQRRHVTDADRSAFLETIRRSFERRLGTGPDAASAIRMYLERIEFADEYPAFAGMIGGPEKTLWVRRIRTAADAAAEGLAFDATDAGAAVWDVFDADGRLLGPIRLPDRFTPLRVEGDAIYGTARDAFDVLHVVRLHLRGLVSPRRARESSRRRARRGRQVVGFLRGGGSRPQGARRSRRRWPRFLAAPTTRTARIGHGPFTIA